MYNLMGREKKRATVPVLRVVDGGKLEKRNSLPHTATHRLRKCVLIFSSCAWLS